mgnify:CR=1 FL=1
MAKRRRKPQATGRRKRKARVEGPGWQLWVVLAGVALVLGYMGVTLALDKSPNRIEYEGVVVSKETLQRPGELDSTMLRQLVLEQEDGSLLTVEVEVSLFEAVKTHHGGQAFLSTTHPGITRGDHFHFSKVERFLVVQGEATIRLRRMFDDRVLEFPVSGTDPVVVDMPTLHTHNITNTGKVELLTMFWAHEIFDPDRPDTYRELVASG